MGERLGDSPDIYAPISLKKALTPDWDAFQDRKNYWIPLFARLKPGVTLAQAAAAINVTYRGQLEKDIQLLASQPKFATAFRAKKIVLRPGQYGRGGLREQSEGALVAAAGDDRDGAADLVRERSQSATGAGLGSNSRNRRAPGDRSFPPAAHPAAFAGIVHSGRGRRRVGARGGLLDSARRHRLASAIQR
jgi:hypothetical protein